MNFQLKTYWVEYSANYDHFAKTTQKFKIGLKGNMGELLDIYFTTGGQAIMNNGEKSFTAYLNIAQFHGALATLEHLMARGKVHVVMTKAGNDYNIAFTPDSFIAAP